MLPSSALLGYIFFRSGHGSLAALFLLNIAVFAIALAVLAFGGRLSEQVLFVTDVLQLNLYLVALAKHCSLLVRGAPSRRLMAEV